MTLQEFLNKFNANENDITEYKGDEALQAIKQSKYALPYVKEQTEEICLEAVKQNKDALLYVDKSIFEKHKVTIELTQSQLDRIKHLI